MVNFVVETSARHVHLSQDVVEVLFGKGHTLTQLKELSQPGEFACQERVSVTGEKSEIKNVIVLGPTRPKTQVELSMSDARSAGIVAPIRESGVLEGSGKCTLTGPAGSVDLEDGVIVAKRHIHIHSDDAIKMNVENKEIVSVEINSDDRSLIFKDVVCRVSDTFATAMHIDTDESNAVGGGKLTGTIIK